MQDLSKWIFSVLGAVVIGFIADMLLSETRLQKTVRYIIATITLLIVVTPLPSLFSGNGFSLDGYELDYSVNLDSEYLDFVLQKKLELLSENTQTVLENAGISNATVTIEGEREESGETLITKVKINLSESVIDEKIQHINRNELASKAVLDYLAVEESVIEIYG